MTEFEKRMMKSQNNDKIIFYDYIQYKFGAGWLTGLRNDDWNRPEIIKRAKYNAEFLQKLPDCYFLGLPIKELLKYNNADGRCHACAIALSLYFKDFKVITCNLKNYAEHYTIKAKNNFYDYSEIDEFEHTFLLINLNGVETVIDTSFGFITDYETYEFIFNPNKIRIITSEELKNVEPYQYIKSLKDYKLNLKCFHQIYIEDKKEWITTEEQKQFEKIIEEYMNICKNYTNDENSHLQDFINRCLFRTSNSSCHWDWRCTLEYGTKTEYPENNMFSLEDDEFDQRLDGVHKNTIERNKMVLENYHKELEEESNKNTKGLKNKTKKMLKLFKKIY